MNFICPFRHNQHQRISPEILNWAQSYCPDREAAGKLFMYRHLVHGTFVIALWVKEGWFVDVLNLGRSLGNFTRERAEIFLEMFNDEHTVAGYTAQMERRTHDYHLRETDSAGTFHDQFQRSRSNTTQVGYSGSGSFNKRP